MFIEHDFVTSSPFLAFFYSFDDDGVVIDIPRLRPRELFFICFQLFGDREVAGGDSRPSLG